MDNSYTNKSKAAVGSRSIHPPYDALLKDNMRKSFPGKHIISKQNNIFLHSVDYGVLLLILQVYTKTSIFNSFHNYSGIANRFFTCTAESEV